MSLDGRVRPCRKGPEFYVDEVRGDRILYRQGDLFELPLSCDGRPKRLASLHELLGRRPSQMDSIDQAAFSPDARWIAVGVHREGDPPTQRVLVRRAGTWRLVAERGMLLGWADAAHVAVGHDGEDPIAVDVRTRARSFFRMPQLWMGSVSPDGRWAVYERQTLRDRYRPDGPWTAARPYRIDRISGRERPLPREASYLPSAEWSPSGDQLLDTPLASGAPRFRISDPRGKAVDSFRTRALPSDHQTDFLAGWLDDSHLWVTAGWVTIVDLTTRRDAVVRLPRAEEFDGLVARVYPITAATRAPMKAGDLVPMRRAKRTGLDGHRLSLRLPPSWKAIPCSCGTSRFRDAVLVGGNGPIDSPYFASGEPLVIATTTDTLEEVIEYLLDEFGTRVIAGFEPLVHRARVRVGNLAMEELEFLYYEGADVFYVGEVGGQTYLLSHNEVTLDRAEPSLRFITDSIRFG